MSVPIAVVGEIPKMRISSGVISEPPPMPVIPTSTPIANPKRTIAGSMNDLGSAPTDFDFPDLLGQECGVRQDTRMEPESQGSQTVEPPLPRPQDPADAIRLRGVSHAYGELQTLDAIDLEARAHGVLGLVGPSGCGKST